jgi:two-component system chemotaxis sensor kinase CheA
MIRNAIDHGVEGPEDRVKAGKDRAGTIELRAFHSGGNIHVQIIDDGRGLNPEKLMAKAREKGILGENERLSDKDAFHLIFAAGFSTAAQVTDISGRGVGMDVVRRNIESMRGRVHIDSVLGQGTTFTIELPLTLAIIDGISVGVGTETFVIPTLSVVEFMQPKEDQITRALDKGETFYFRGKYLPLYRLGNLFHVEPKRTALTESLVVVVENVGQHFAILVDEISSTHSTVIKSVGEMFTTNRGIAGCAIMPNGDIALILDLRSLLEMAKDTYSYNQVYSQRELSRDVH